MNKAMLLFLFPLIVVSAQTSEIASNEQQINKVHQELNDKLNSTQKAIIHLTDTYEDEYPNGQQYLKQAAGFKDQIQQTTSQDLTGLRDDINAFQKTALTENPLVNRQPVLFVVRDQYLNDHHSTATMFQTGEINTSSFRGGSALKSIDFRTGRITTWLELNDGIVRDLEVHFDGQRVLFSMRKSIEDDYHIYEMDMESQQIKQLTDGGGLSDIDPIYLPNDDIVFVSTREPKFCQCNRHIMGNLFRMGPQGDNIHQIGRNTLFEGHPSLLPDGRILYDRWEYVDKHFGPAFGLWTTYPDGTNHVVYYGNNAWSPGGIMDARSIPDTSMLIATLGSCHDRPWGAIGIIDREVGMDGNEPVVHSWPDDLSSLITNNTGYGKGKQRNHPHGGQIDNFTRLEQKYEDPFPLSDTYFLCSRTIEGERTGIFLLDRFGNEICLYEEQQGCFDPMPLKPSDRPTYIPSRVDYSKDTGLLYVADVYTGGGMEQVERGVVKTLRVIEAPVKRFWTQTNWNLDATQAPAMNFNCTNNKRILGDVPVENDGSAYLEVPADTFIYFQLLDQNGMMVQTMRSGTIVRPGELQGCIGCHDDRQAAPKFSGDLQALQRKPSNIEHWYGEPRDFNYLTEVQPVFDRYCVKCHDYDKKAGEALNLSGDLGLAFNTSYLELRNKSALRWYRDQPSDKKLLVKAVDDGPAEVLPPYAWGSHRSRLVDVIQSGHQNLEIDQESMARIITWIDLNAPYYGSYASVYPDNVFGRSPLTNDQIDELRELTGVMVGDISTELEGSQCNFTRPEHSPCLIGLSPANYQRALEIIREGKMALQQKPRMDMPGAQMLECDVVTLEKYESRKREEDKAKKNLQLLELQ
ncbi:MAG: hypothetical protein P9L94_16455 [Candidatus Hinthialibacter antarcticus]|nr:hypothetical protein [Candidatus Hinthialibacter antarcticus]